MNIQQDFKELLQLLEKYQVDYMIVGGYAVAFHGYPRFTKDLDVFYLNSKVNVERLLSALCSFGFEKNSLPVESFLEKGSIITFGLAPVRVDFLNQIDGVDFCQATPNRDRGQYGGIGVYFIGKNDLIKNKSSTNRTQDKADVEKLAP